jgi:hypothetical protein
MQLSKNKIEYLFFHLRQHWQAEPQLTTQIRVLEANDDSYKTAGDQIIFLTSALPTPQPAFINFEKQQLPILFPLETTNSLFRRDKNNNLIFCHDYLSSAFYLLSGKQETEITERDKYNRFPYAASLQNTLGFTTLPLVNYYFEIILQGFEDYAAHHNFKIRRKRLFQNFGFLLSHDVDRVAFHHPRNVAYKVKQIIGLSPLTYSFTKTIRLLISGILFNLNPFATNDPWWNFDWLINLEKQLGIRSTFYFLKREDGAKNAQYNLKDKKIKKLINKLLKDDFEVSLHGTIASANQLESLISQKEEMKTVTGIDCQGIRQHYLMFYHPQTFKIQQAAHFIYDTTLAFAEHDGYRNSYCYPFHPYDFENDNMMDIWEIPLVIMEASILQYRKAGLSEMTNAVEHYIEEAQKFGGIFSLLWHNCRLNDIEYEGISEYYKNLLKHIIKKSPKPLTGKCLINRLTNPLSSRC